VWAILWLMVGLMGAKDRGPWVPSRLWLVALVLTSCSDDGLAPEAAMDAGTTGNGETSSVNTSATITAAADTADDPDGTASPGETAGDSSGALDATGPLEGSSGFEGTTGTGGDDEGSSDGIGPAGTSGGEDEPACVALDDCACDPGEVSCEVEPPVCPAGLVPEVDPGLACWTFACVPADACGSVPDCLACGDDLACVVYETLAGPTVTCEVVLPACMGDPSCECMSDACADPFECLDPPQDSETDLACVCVAC
jgi:hypothetical protein